MNKKADSDFVILDSHWYGASTRHGQKIHYLHSDGLTFCGLHETHLAQKPKVGRYCRRQLCARCLFTVESYTDLANFVRYNENSDNMRSKGNETYSFDRTHGYLPYPPFMKKY